MPTSEFDLIDAFVKHFPKAPVTVGVGDDCAVVSQDSKTELCVTTDAVVEGVHFTRRQFSFEDIGHKALAVNLSDLAAMGAQPAWFVCAIGWPKALPSRAVHALARGMSKLAVRSGIFLVGGNFTSSQQLTLTLTVAGTVPKGKALRRSGARAGDGLYVSGRLGDARMGLSKRPFPEAARRQKRPTPRLELGLLARGFASACIDLSDGLAQDVGHVCRASNVGALIHLEALPVSRSLLAKLGKRAPMFAAEGGEDYELLLAVPPKKAPAFEAAAKTAQLDITRIGTCVSGPGEWLWHGQKVAPPKGFDHFRMTQASPFALAASPDKKGLENTETTRGFSFCAVASEK